MFRTFLLETYEKIRSTNFTTTFFHFQPKFEFFSTGSPAFTVGGDTVISSLTPEKRYYFDLCRIFYKDLFSVSVRGLFKLSNAFSFCNFVYWFSI